MVHPAKAARWEIATTQKIAHRLTETLKDDTAHLADSTVAGALARGRTFATAGYDTDAIESFKEALCMDPHANEAAARLALVLLRIGRNSEALTVASKLAASAPKYSMREATSDEKINSFTILGKALAQNGRIAEAIHACEAATKNDSHDTTAPALLAYLHLATGEPKRALGHANAFANNPRFHDLASVMSLGHTNEALLPAFNRESVQDFLRVMMPGRPLFVEGDARLSPTAQGDDWCATASDLLGEAPGDEPAR